MNDGTVTLNFKLHLARLSRRIVVRDGAAPVPFEVARRLPRVTRLLVQAHRFQRMIDQGMARDLADLARQLGLTRARVTQIVNYTLLAPDIQEEILHLPPVERADTHGHDEIEKHVTRGQHEILRRHRPKGQAAGGHLGGRSAHGLGDGPRRPVDGKHLAGPDPIRHGARQRSWATAHLQHTHARCQRQRVEDGLQAFGQARRAHAGFPVGVVASSSCKRTRAGSPANGAAASTCMLSAAHDGIERRRWSQVFDIPGLRVDPLLFPRADTPFACVESCQPQLVVHRHEHAHVDPFPKLGSATVDPFQNHHGRRLHTAWRRLQGPIEGVPVECAIGE
jgi:hypothetical protein